MSVIVGPDVYRKLIKRPIFFLNLHLIIFEDLLTFSHLKILWKTWILKRNKMFHTRVFVIKHERHDNLKIQNYYIFYICKGQIRKFRFKKTKFHFSLNETTARSSIVRGSPLEISDGVVRRPLPF